ncbi:uncharacterized protein LOC113226315 isoform X2 [Hyposmocoma kahamanoa]|uniref:uncharacterized protein LOC113226315 isoform X2 n=1 Tax=Hyposmocoma kahamanoa TaxID=1477025 RepID=UPI000E6D7F67|nr:uncharacterized protein LOC113226315 isoform X2 [Hyposmocoma kahamanoa]
MMCSKQLNFWICSNHLFREQIALIHIVKTNLRCLFITRWKICKDLEVIVVMPVDVPLSLREKITKLGATIILHGRNLNDVDTQARSVAHKNKLVYINSRDYVDILAGYGTIALEILQDIPLVDAVIVPVGTGGLAAAIAVVIKHKKKNCLIYGVQPEEARAFFTASKSEDAARSFVPETTLANSLTMSKVGANAYHNALPLLDKMLLVKESWIGQAMLHMMEHERYVVEGAAACPLAAIIGQLVPELKNKTVVCIVSGGNIDSFLLSRCLQFGKAAEARFLKFTVEITDTSLSQADLFELLRKKNYSVIDQTQEHRWTNGDTYKCKLTLHCQTHDLEHALKLRRLIQKTYPLSSEFENEPFVDKRTCECYAYSYTPYIPKPPVEDED